MSKVNKILVSGYSQALSLNPREITVITILVNLAGSNEVQYTDIYSGLEEAVKAAKLLHPSWTSMVITLVNERALSKAP